MKNINALEFCIAVSMSDFVTWFGDKSGEFLPNADLQAALQTLGVNANIQELYSTYFDNTQVGSGDVHVYQLKTDNKNIFAVDMYRGLTDQMDIVSLVVSCDAQCAPTVRNRLRAFWDGASCQVHYEEASYSTALHNMVDAARYPFAVEESDYQQLVHINYG